MKVLKESDSEALVMILGTQASMESREMDFCQLDTRTGNLVVGLSNVDKYDAKVGFWKKLTSVFSDK